MRRIIPTVLLTLLLLSVFTLCACEKDDKMHDEILNEIAESNRIKNEKRKAFLSSEVYAGAYDYVLDTLFELVPGCTAEISLEPGTLLGDDLSGFADFSANADTRLSFFSEAQLSITVDFWDFDVEPLTLCDKLMSRQISGEMAVDQYGEDTYQFDAVSGEVSLYKMPGV